MVPVVTSALRLEQIDNYRHLDGYALTFDFSRNRKRRML